MAEEIVFTLRLTKDDWDPGLNAWRSPALDIPSAFIKEARDANAKIIPLEVLTINKGPARVTWIGAGQPTQLSVIVRLGEKLSPASNEEFWKKFAIVVPIITAIIGAGAIWLAKPDPGTSHTLRLRVDPNDIETSGLPPARITLNNQQMVQPIDYKVASDVMAIVDVSKAVDYVKTLGEVYKEQKAVAATTITALVNAANDVRAIGVSVGGPICSGGAHGVPPINAGSLTQQAAEISDKLKEISGDLKDRTAINVVPVPN